jgi:hypothetical protein
MAVGTSALSPNILIQMSQSCFLFFANAMQRNGCGPPSCPRSSRGAAMGTLRPVFEGPTHEEQSTRCWSTDSTGRSPR